MVYSNWCLDALESSLALNLITLAASTTYTHHVSNSKGNQIVVGYTSVFIVFLLFIGILVYQLANVTGIAQYMQRKCAAATMRNQVENSPTGYLPDQLINPVGYEPPFHTLQRHATAEQAEEESVVETQRRLIPVYYLSLFTSLKKVFVWIWFNSLCSVCSLLFDFCWNLTEHVYLLETQKSNLINYEMLQIYWKDKIITVKELHALSTTYTSSLGRQLLVPRQCITTIMFAVLVEGKSISSHVW